ncbi:MAG: Isoleucine--tRNA ligase [candidate division WS2 bacterium ADurb.Bin280]|uniref:Isoleucine--tRNA ligase n=1 Tax=candidate division WS2 bacterium ADurb.Bin280 TaxID=1852829 RepID=A0A1V5SDQ8_9BACT|nr:MAG: Isoleucine--tRNA ligase [candidate division WS2 bacterium ADurb.Bin280]
MENKNPYVGFEQAILEYWRKEKIFERCIKERKEADEYVFYDGPPFATGLPHYGHILSSVIKDLIPRYQTMRGRRVDRRWGWDCHGLPIETLVEKKLGISGKKQIEQRGVGEFNSTARSMVLEYADAWEGMVERIGRFVEFKNSYKTMDATFMESVWWALKRLWEKDLIYEGRKVLMYCPRCETPVSNAEIQMDNSYKNVEDESAYVKFKILENQKISGENVGDNFFFLAWTTTPWTLPANVALAVGKDIDYALVEDKQVKEKFVVASDLVEKIFSENKISVLKKDIKGADLKGLNYQPLYEIEAVKGSGKKAWFVAPADFVNTQEGTGIVHTAVIYGEDDFALGLELDLPQVPLLDSKARYNQDAPKFIRDKYIKDAEDEILSDLKNRGLLFKTEKYSHSYPFCWRCDSPLIYNAISAWFININKEKDRLIEENEKISWHPENLKHGRFLNILKTAPDWNISRNRYWATPLPFWRCDSCGEVACIGSVKELSEKSVNFDQVYPNCNASAPIQNDATIDLHKPQIDEVILKCTCSGEMKRVDEVVDCWVESASMPFAQWHYPFENKQEFEAKYPGQFIGEYIAQTRAWFYYMHVMGVLLFDEISFENVVATGTILNEKGEKLSKSKNNFVDPSIIIEKYGADALRFYLMNSVVMQADNLFFNEKDLRDIYNKVINLTHNILKFYEIYAQGRDVDDISPKDLSDTLDKWIFSVMESAYSSYLQDLEDYDTVRASRTVKDFIDDASTWWLRRSRERFRLGDENALRVLRQVIIRLSQMLAPFAPFIAEYAWQKVKDGQMNDSVHLSILPETDSSLIDLKLEEQMRKARSIVELGHSIRSNNSLKVRQPLSAITWNLDLESQSLEEIILQELNVINFTKDVQMVKPLDASKDNLTVTIEANLTDDLLKLGDVREISRAIQDLRKKSGKKAGEKVTIVVLGANDLEKNFIKENDNTIRKATDVSSFEIVDDRTFDKVQDVLLSFGTVSIAIGEKNSN